MINFKSEKSSIYRIAVPIMQVLVSILMLLSLAFNNTYENLSDVLRKISMGILLVIAGVLGIKELLVRKNKLSAYLLLGFTFVMLV